jgi:hypothetical protein
MHTTVEAQRIAQGLKKRFQFFLTNSVPLVHQQANILAHKYNRFPTPDLVPKLTPSPPS